MYFDRRRRLFIPLIALAALALGGCSDSKPQSEEVKGQLLAVPASTGSLGPNLAAGPNGEIVLSWLEPDGNRHRLLYSVLIGGAWSEAATVAAGDDWFVNWADFPSVVPLSDSLWAAHWLVRQPAGGYAYDVLLSLSTDGGSTWSEPLKPHSDGTPTEHGFVTLFPSGSDLGLIWLDGRNMSNPPTTNGITDGMTLRAASIAADLSITNEAEVDELTCDCCQTDIAITANSVVAVYRDRTEAETRDIYAARLTGSRWQPGQPVADDGWTINGCPVNGPVIEADGDHVAVAWFTAAGGRPRVRIARSVDAGITFAAPVDVVEENTSGHTGLALLPDNGLAVSWICERSEGNAGVCLRTVSKGDRLGPVHVLSGDSRIALFSVPQLAISGDSLIAAWTEEAAGGTLVASAEFPVASLH